MIMFIFKPQWVDLAPFLQMGADLVPFLQMGADLVPFLQMGVDLELLKKKKNQYGL